MPAPLPTPYILASVSLYAAAESDLVVLTPYVSVLHGIDQRLVLLAGIMLGAYGRAWIAYSRDAQDELQLSMRQRLGRAASEWFAAISFALPLAPMGARWIIALGHKWEIPPEAFTPAEVLLTTSAALAFMSSALTGLAFRWLSRPSWPPPSKSKND